MSEKEEQQKTSIDKITNGSSPSVQTTTVDNTQSLPTNSKKVKSNPDLDNEFDNLPKKQKINEETSSTLPQNSIKSQMIPKKSSSIDYQDLSFNEKTSTYCSFSNTNKKSNKSETNPVQQLLNKIEIPKSVFDDEEDEQKKKIAAAKKLLFPGALATSFPEVADTLRHERRQEFCPIYKDETSEQIALRQSKQKPIGSLLAKRIRWDDLKRKRDEEEKKLSQMPTRYGSYGPLYPNQQPQQQQAFNGSYEQYNKNLQNQTQQTFANPYEQYYAAVQHQYEQMAQLARVQQEHNGFWPEYQQQQQQQQNQPYTYPYPYAYYSNMSNIPSSSSYMSNNYNLYLNNLMQPPPPPPNEPYPY